MGRSDEIAALVRVMDEASRRMFDPLAEKVEVPLDPDIDLALTDAGLTLAVSPPLIHSLYAGPFEHEVLNASLKLKRALFEEDIHAGKWSAVLFAVCQRPYRAEVLYDLGIERDVMPDEDYWRMVGEVWTDSENCYQNLDLWEEMFTADKPGREAIMDKSERKALAKLPDPIPVFHGVDGSEFAWTTDKGVAEWFARRFPKHRATYLLREGLAPKDKVLAYFDRRNEQEVVILRADVLDEREYEIPPRPVEYDKPTLARALRTMDNADPRKEKRGDASVDLPA